MINDGRAALPPLSDLKKRRLEPVCIKPLIHNGYRFIKQIILHADARGNPLDKKVDAFNGLGAAINRPCG